MRSASLISLCLVFILLSTGMQIIYDQNRDYFSERRVFLSLPKAQNLKIMSLGFDHFVADLLYIWAIQFYSSYQIKNRFEYIEHIFDLITDLNPKYRDVYHIGSLIMAKEKGDVEMAIRLLLKGARHIPGEYFFYFDAGFYALWDLQQYDRARTLFKKALEIPAVPEKRRLLIRNMIAHTLFYANDLRASFRAWLEIYRSEDSLPHQRKVARTRLYTIKADLDKQMIREAVSRYREKHQRLPESLEELAARGYIERVPRDFFGYDYLYDPKTGQVSAPKAFKIYRRQ